MTTKPEEQRQVDEILSFLRAYQFPVMQKALKSWRLAEAKARADELWKPFAGRVEDIPPNHEWREVGSKIQIRPIGNQTAIAHSVRAATQPLPPVDGKKKTDLSVKSAGRVRCPDCGGEVFKEGVCPGCADGRKGYRIRLLCGECDYTELL